MNRCLLSTFLVFLFFFTESISAQNVYNKWFPGSATFYGDMRGNANLGGACGYSQVPNFGVGIYNAAAASFLWKRGKGCGACYDVKCDSSRNRREFCKYGKIVTVTITNMCPRGGLGWCNPPRRHLDMSMPSFLKIAIYRAGYVNALLRRVPCKRKGQIKFKTGGNPYFLTLVVANLAGYGEIRSIYAQIDKSRSPWIKFHQNWGALYSKNKRFFRHRMNIKIVLLNGQTLVIRGALPQNWRMGSTYSAGQFFSGRTWNGRRKVTNRNLRVASSSDSPNSSKHNPLKDFHLPPAAVAISNVKKFALPSN